MPLVFLALPQKNGSITNIRWFLTSKWISLTSYHLSIFTENHSWLKIDSIDCEYGLISISHQEYNHIIALNIKSIIAISRQYTDATIRKNHDNSITCWDTMNQTIIKAIKEDLISQETNISPELSDDIVSLFSRLWNLLTLSFCNNSSNSSYLST